jgi:hypothetical protein
MEHLFVSASYLGQASLMALQLGITHKHALVLHVFLADKKKKTHKMGLTKCFLAEKPHGSYNVVGFFSLFN